jgi:hypothetical protein
MAKPNPEITSCDPGVSDVFPKLSGERDYSIGWSGNDKGRVNRSDFTDKQWSTKDVLETGLTVRQPL